MGRIAYVGIDPGLHGVVAVISPAGTVQFHDLPTLEVPVRGGSGGGGKAKLRHVPDEPAIAQIFRSIRAGFAEVDVGVCATLERVTPMPARKDDPRCPACGRPKNTQPPGSMFTFGYGYALIAMALAAFEIPHERVMPHSWKAKVLGEKRGKGAELEEASRLYPMASGQLRGPRGGILEGRVDALLIAHYGARFGKLSPI